MNLIGRHINIILFIVIASLLITQQELVSHDHGIMDDDCVICKMVGHNNSLVPITPSFAVIFIIIGFISFEFRHLLLPRRNWATPALRAPPSLL